MDVSGFAANADEVKAERQKHVPDAISVLNTRANDLARVVDHLETMLQPVLGPPAPALAPTTTMAEETYPTPLASAIDLNMRIVQEQARRIHELVERIEL